MTKLQIAKILVTKFNKHIDTQAFLRFNRDWSGDMEMRKKMCDRFMTKEMAVEENAILLVGREIWNDLKDQRMSIIETDWWKNRKFNYDGEPLTDGEIKTRDWAKSRKAKAA
tara:strand:- start:438 stop:773 length:336 start_codon:yes stop_codon:yes gene_type:complete